MAKYMKRIEETSSLSNSGSLFSQVMAPKSSRKISSGSTLAASTSSLRKRASSRVTNNAAFDKRPRTMTSVGGKIYAIR